MENKSELKVYAEQVGDYIVQPFIEGTEYTVDIFCDYEGNQLFITPRIRVAVRAGEVLKTEIAMDEKIIEECRKLIAGFQPCGPMTVQLIRQNKTDDDYYIEINPRFGGGAPLSMKAGARSAEAILKLLSGEKVDYSDVIDDGAVYSRFDQSVCTAEGKRKQPILGVIFDLDDTLYSEKQYVRSGYKEVANLLGDEALADRLWAYFENGKPAIDELLKELGCMGRKEECLEAYLGKKRKIQALGLDKLIDDIIITDELGGTQFRKPCDITFRIMQRRRGLPFEQMVYVGDNAEKDFQAPKQLGMISVFFRNKEGIYSDNNKNDVQEIDMISELSF